MIRHFYTTNFFFPSMSWCDIFFIVLFIDVFPFIFYRFFFFATFEVISKHCTDEVEKRTKVMVLELLC